MGTRWVSDPDPRHGIPAQRRELPHVPGFVVVHDHEEGWPCHTSGLTYCQYHPSLWSRLKAWLGLP